MIVVGVIIFGASFTVEPVMWESIVIGVVLFITGVLLFTVFNKFTNILVEVSEEGIFERAAKVSKGVIRWEEIEKVHVYDLGTSNPFALNDRPSDQQNRVVGIFLKDPDAFARKLNFAQQGVIKTALNNGWAPINIPCRLLGDDTEELVKICNNLLKSYR
jgi:hypothetical protein